jgi:hypothetical protein
VQPFKIMRKAKAEQDKQREVAASLGAMGSALGVTVADALNGDALPAWARPQPGYATIPDAAAESDRDQRNPLLHDEEAPRHDDSDDDDDANDSGDAAADAAADTQAALNTMLSALGLGGPLADDAQWLQLHKVDAKTRRRKPRGKIALSVAIVPLAECASKPAGVGRTEPNANPHLPPPPGRLKLSFHPWRMLRLLVPARVLCCLCCLLVFGVSAAVVQVGGSYFVFFETWKNSL